MRHRISLIIAVALSLGIFTLDLFTPVGYADWALYLIPIMVASSSLKESSLALFSAMVTGLNLAGFLLSPPGGIFHAAVANRLLSILAIWIVTYFTMRRLRAEETLRRLSRQNELILNAAGEGIVGVDATGYCTFINKSAASMLGYGVGELVGKHSHNTFHYAKADGTLYPPEECPIYAAHRDGTVHSGEEMFWRKDGTSFPVDFTSRPLSVENKLAGAVVTFSDATERKRIEEEIRHMAHHDELTGLPNRRLFLDIVRLELAQARRSGRKFAVMFLDLDRFKEVNDTLGHEAGDKLLKEVAGRLVACIRKTDTIARIGGDEFNVILADLVRGEDISVIAQKIIDTFRPSYQVAGNELHVTTSIGISVYPDDSDDIDTLFRYADIALYHAKESGRNAFRFYNPQINVRSLDWMRMANRLRQSIGRNELTVYFQPQIDINTRTLVSAEALVRWRHPEMGLLEPKRFIPLAEETGLIPAVDEWVMRTVCKQAKAWQDEGFLSLCVTVNLSARCLQSPDEIRLISRILSDTGLDPGCLDLEITESAAMGMIERNAGRLRELSEMGVHISIDDFGTGYSSLSSLKRLPVKKLKIDRSFINGIATDPDARAVISAMTAMAHTMEMRVAAEGVESEEQLSFLHAIHCDEAQGYLFSRPLPAEEFEELIAAGTQRKYGR